MATETHLPYDPESRQRREAFYALANARYAEFLASRKGIPLEDMCTYLQDRAAGKPSKLPEPRHIDL